LGPKGPWPWGALLGLFFIVVGLLGLLFPLPPQTFSDPPSTTQS